MARAISIIVAAGAGLCAATAVHAENWYPFFMRPQGVAYVDKDSIIRRPGQVSARVQSTFPTTERLQKAGRIVTYTKSIDTIDVDCKAGVYRYRQRALFNDAGQEQSTISDPNDIRPIQDGTPEDVLAKAFCPKS